MLTLGFSWTGQIDRGLLNLVLLLEMTKDVFTFFWNLDTFIVFLDLERIGLDFIAKKKRSDFVCQQSKVSENVGISIDHALNVCEFQRMDPNPKFLKMLKFQLIMP